MDIVELTSGHTDRVLGRTGRQKISTPMASDWVQFAAGDVMAGVTGPATAVTAVVERSFIDPAAGGADIAHPAGSTPITGNPSTGLAPNVYRETATGWWRINVTALTGSYVYVSLAGTMT